MIPENIVELAKKRASKFSVLENAPIEHVLWLLETAKKRAELYDNDISYHNSHAMMLEKKLSEELCEIHKIEEYLATLEK